MCSSLRMSIIICPNLCLTFLSPRAVLNDGAFSLRRRHCERHFNAQVSPAWRRDYCNNVCNIVRANT